MKGKGELGGKDDAILMLCFREIEKMEDDGQFQWNWEGGGGFDYFGNFELIENV